MSKEETGAFAVSLVISAIAWLRWYYLLFSARGPRGAGMVPLLILPLLCPVMCMQLLRIDASEPVRENPTYQMLFVALGAAWVGITMNVSEAFGVAMRDDAQGHGNGAAVALLSGALCGSWLAYTGGNFGDIPGWWAVLFCAVATSIALLLTWAAVDRMTVLSDRVLLDRDLSSGLRFGGFLIAAGLVLGRGAAGDWVSADATIRGILGVSWPVLAAAAVEVMLSSAVPRSSIPNGTRAVLLGFVPALVYISAAWKWVDSLGSWK